MFVCYVLRVDVVCLILVTEKLFASFVKRPLTVFYPDVLVPPCVCVLCFACRVSDFCVPLM